MGVRKVSVGHLLLKSLFFLKITVLNSGEKNTDCSFRLKFAAIILEGFVIKVLGIKQR